MNALAILILLIVGVVGIVSGVPYVVDAGNVMEQLYAGIHVLGGVALLGIAYLLIKVEALLKRIPKPEPEKKEKEVEREVPQTI